MKNRFLGQSAGEWAVILLVALALLGGWALKVAAENQTISYTLDGFSFALPAGWRVLPEPGGVRCSELTATLGSPRLEVQNRPLEGGESALKVLSTAADSLAMERAGKWISFRTQDRQDTIFQGQPALLVDYMFVEDDPNALDPHLPVVMQGKDLLAWQGGRLWIWIVQAEVPRFPQAERLFQMLIDSAKPLGGA